MSMKVYRLLRNNKEEGPYTVEELISKNLKTYDLIWINGRSAAWNYPGELAEFKMIAPLPGFETGVFDKRETPAISQSVQAAIAVNDNIIQPVKNKPRFKVSASWSKIQTVNVPGTNEVVTIEKKHSAKKPMVMPQHVESEPSKPLSWQEAWLDWEKEKQVTPVYAPVKTTSFSKAKNKNYSKPVAEPKYSQQADDIKDSYNDNIFQQKKQSKKILSLGKASEFIVPAAALIIIFSVAYWLLHKTNTTIPSLPTTHVNSKNGSNAVNTNAIVKANNNAVSNEATAPLPKQNEQPSVKNEIAIPDQAEERDPINKISNKIQPVSQPDKIAVKQNTSANKDDVLKDKLLTTVKQPVVSIGNTNISNPVNQQDANATRPVRRRTNTDDSSIASPTVKNNTITPVAPVKKTSSNYVNVPEYIAMNNGSANINIENVSDVDLDLVVVDVQYYDSNNHFRKGETMYLHNLRAGKNITIKTSKDLNSSYATSKVALISSDAKQVYVVGDN